MEWIKVSDKLPMEDQVVIAWDGNYVGQAVYFTKSCYPDIKWFWYQLHDYESEGTQNVTHWMENVFMFFYPIPYSFIGFMARI